MEFLKEMLNVYVFYIPVCVGIGLLLGTGVIVLMDMIEQKENKNERLGSKNVK